MNDPLPSYEELRDEVNRLRLRLASLERIQIECEEARNTATAAISARDEAVRAMLDSERQYRDLAEALPQLIWITRPDGWHVYFNKKWCTYTGLTLEESCGHGWNHAFHPDDRQRAWNRWKLATETGEAYEIEYRLRRADGSYHWVLGRALPLRDASGQIVKWFGTCTDIDDQKQAEEALRDANQRLAKLDRAKTAFFSNVSHEFRTPLTLILGPLEDLLAQRTLPTEVREALAVIQRNSQRLLRLVNTLLNFSRIEAGRVQASYQPTDLAALTVGLAGSFRSACERAGLRLRVDCPPLDEPVYVDGGMWEEIVLNLLSNAFKFTFEGEIEVKLRGAGTTCELSVRDTGIGIPEAELPRIFERFHRVEGASGRSFEGTGIGLALVRELVKLHGGDLAVHSLLGQGSTFAVTLPFGMAHLPAERIRDGGEATSLSQQGSSYVAEALQWLVRDPAGGEPSAEAFPAADGALPSSAGPPPGIERPRVLLADDNADMREYVRHLLAPHYYIESCADGQAALEAAQRHRPCLVLADVMMPRLDGFGLLKALRADPRLTTVPVVLLSARAGEEAQVEGLEAGADDYLVKPFSARELLARVTAHIELARLREEVQRAAGRAGEEARIRRLINANIIGIVFWNLAGAITEANDTFLDLVGYSREELVSGKVRWTDMTPPEWRHLDAAAIEELKATGTFRPVEKEYLRKDGSRVPVLLAGALFEGSQDQGVAFVLDLSERKRAEAERQAREAAEAASRAKSEFLASMSHELRTPLNAILGYAQILRGDRTLNERQRDGLDVIRHSGDHLLALINDMLDCARIEAGKLELSPSDLALAPFLHAIAGMIKVKAAEKGLRLVCDLAPDLPAVVCADERRLRQVLLNLLANAVKFTERGTVTLRVGPASPGRLRFEVADTGIGIASEQLGALFQPFVQAGETRHHIDSIGLGLAISRQLVQLMGGDIRVESRVGQSSRFWFDVALPEAAAAVAAKATPAGAVTGYEGPRRKILVVDDVVENRKLLMDMLAPLGFALVAAESGGEGVDKARAGPPDLILMDIVMPGMDGLEAIRQLRRLPALRDTPIIAVSARASESDERSSLEAGANAFLPKPIDAGKLLAQLADLLQIRWIGEAPGAEEPPALVPQTGEAPLMIPPAPEMAALHRLAVLGNMRDIQAWASHVAEIDAGYGPFARQLSELARGYQSKAILSLVERHLGKGGE